MAGGHDRRAASLYAAVAARHRVGGGLPARLGIVSPAALPPLDKVATACLDLAASGDLWTNGVASISCAAAGLGNGRAACRTRRCGDRAPASAVSCR